MCAGGYFPFQGQSHSGVYSSQIKRPLENVIDFMVAIFTFNLCLFSSILVFVVTYSLNIHVST